MIRYTLAVLCASLLPAALGAHYPYFLVDQAPAKQAAVRFVFEEGPVVGDGEYLDPFIRNATFWARTPEQKQPMPLPTQEIDNKGKRWLALSPPATPARAIDCYCKWGVYQGKLLHYYARFVQARSAEELAALARAEKLRFDLVPRVKGEDIEVEVLWEGKPSAGKSVLVFGPKFRTTVVSDKDGLIRFAPKEAGSYALRTAFIDPQPSGIEDGKEYKGLRHTATMNILLPIASGN